jgi:hypothetical protein
MKTRNRKTTKPASVREAETAWPLLTAYLDLAERHTAVLIERLDAALACARQAKEKQIESDVAAIMANVEAVIEALPAPNIFNPTK